MNGAFQPFCRLCTPENTVPAKPDAAFFWCDTAKESLGKGRKKKKAAVALRLCQRGSRGSSRWKVCLRSTQREIYFVSSCEEVPTLALHELNGSWKHRSTYPPTNPPIYPRLPETDLQTPLQMLWSGIRTCDPPTARQSGVSSTVQLP